MLSRLTAAFLIVIMLIPAPLGAAPQSPQTEEDQAEEPTGLAARMEERAVARGLEGPIDPDTYVIGPSDEFLLVLSGATENKHPLLVLPEGTVILPNIGAFQAAGLTITEFRTRLKDALRSYYRNMDIDCQLVFPRTFITYVLGAVGKPGAVELVPPFRLSTAIEVAGGVVKDGSRRRVEIREGNEVINTVDLFVFAHEGDVSQNPVLREGQTVFVPFYETRVTIMGEVRRGRAYEMLPGETIGDLLDFAGGFTSSAVKDRIVLERLEANGDVAVKQLDIAEARDITVMDRDVVVVPDNRSFPGVPHVMVFGGGGRQGKFNIKPGETLAEFVPRMIRFGEEHDLSKAVLERRTESGQPVFIPFDAEKIAAGEAPGDEVLASGDIINVPAVDKVVYVGGEVVAPAEIPFQRGLPAGRYVAMAGGPNESGSIDKLLILSLDGTSRKASRDSIVFRGETILVQRRTSKIIGSIFIGLTSLTSLILSIVAVTR